MSLDVHGHDLTIQLGDELKRHIKSCDVDPSQWEKLASDSGEWR